MKQVLPCQLPDCPDGTDPCNPQTNALKSDSTFVKSEAYAATEGFNHMPVTVWTTSSPTTVNLEESTSETLDSTPFMSTFKNEARTQSSLSVGQNNVVGKQLFENVNEGISTNTAQSENMSSMEFSTREAPGIAYSAEYRALQTTENENLPVTTSTTPVAQTTDTIVRTVEATQILASAPTAASTPSSRRFSESAEASSAETVFLTPTLRQNQVNFNIIQSTTIGDSLERTSISLDSTNDKTVIPPTAYGRSMMHATTRQRNEQTATYGVAFEEVSTLFDGKGEITTTKKFAKEKQTTNHAAPDTRTTNHITSWKQHDHDRSSPGSTHTSVTTDKETVPFSKYVEANTPPLFETATPQNTIRNDVETTTTSIKTSTQNASGAVIWTETAASAFGFEHPKRVDFSENLEKEADGLSLAGTTPETSFISAMNERATLTENLIKSGTNLYEGVVSKAANMLPEFSEKLERLHTKWPVEQEDEFVTFPSNRFAIYSAGKSTERQPIRLESLAEKTTHSPTSAKETDSFTNFVSKQPPYYELPSGATSTVNIGWSSSKADLHSGVIISKNIPTASLNDLLNNRLTNSNNLQALATSSIEEENKETINIYQDFANANTEDLLDTSFGDVKDIDTVNVETPLFDLLENEDTKHLSDFGVRQNTTSSQELLNASSSQTKRPPAIKELPAVPLKKPALSEAPLFDIRAVTKNKISSKHEQRQDKLYNETVSKVTSVPLGLIDESSTRSWRHSEDSDATKRPHLPEKSEETSAPLKRNSSPETLAMTTDAEPMRSYFDLQTSTGSVATKTTDDLSAIPTHAVNFNSLEAGRAQKGFDVTQSVIEEHETRSSQNLSEVSTERTQSSLFPHLKKNHSAEHFPLSSENQNTTAAIDVGEEDKEHSETFDVHQIAVNVSKSQRIPQTTLPWNLLEESSGVASANWTKVTETEVVANNTSREMISRSATTASFERTTTDTPAIRNLTTPTSQVTTNFLRDVLGYATAALQKSSSLEQNKGGASKNVTVSLSSAHIRKAGGGDLQNGSNAVQQKLKRTIALTTTSVQIHQENVAESQIANEGSGLVDVIEASGQANVLAYTNSNGSLSTAETLPTPVATTSSFSVQEKHFNAVKDESSGSGEEKLLLSAYNAVARGKCNDSAETISAAVSSSSTEVRTEMPNHTVADELLEAKQGTFANTSEQSVHFTFAGLTTNRPETTATSIDDVATSHDHVISQPAPTLFPTVEPRKTVYLTLVSVVSVAVQISEADEENFRKATQSMHSTCHDSLKAANDFLKVKRLETVANYTSTSIADTETKAAALAQRIKQIEASFTSSKNAGSTAGVADAAASFPTNDKEQTLRNRSTQSLTAGPSTQERIQQTTSTWPGTARSTTEHPSDGEASEDYRGDIIHSSIQSNRLKEQTHLSSSENFANELESEATFVSVAFPSGKVGFQRSDKTQASLDNHEHPGINDKEHASVGENMHLMIDEMHQTFNEEPRPIAAFDNLDDIFAGVGGPMLEKHEAHWPHENNPLLQGGIINDPPPGGMYESSGDDLSYGMEACVC